MYQMINQLWKICTRNELFELRVVVLSNLYLLFKHGNHSVILLIKKLRLHQPSFLPREWLKEKDPLHYNPSKLMDPRTQESPKRIKRMFGKLVTTSGGRPGGRNTSTRTYRELSDGEEETTEYVTIGECNNT